MADFPPRPWKMHRSSTGRLCAGAVFISRPVSVSPQTRWCDGRARSRFLQAGDRAAGIGGSPPRRSHARSRWIRGSRCAGARSRSQPWKHRPVICLREKGTVVRASFDPPRGGRADCRAGRDAAFPRQGAAPLSPAARRWSPESTPPGHLYPPVRNAAVEQHRLDRGGPAPMARKPSGGWLRSPDECGRGRGA